MDLALEAIGETGTDGTVDHARGERALLGGTRLALQITARDATDGVHLLDEVDGQREEVVVLLFLRNDCGDQNGGFALGNQDSAGSLLRELAGLESIVLAVQFEGFNDFCHAQFFLFFADALLRLDFFGC